MLQGVEKHLWAPVTICNHVNISTQNQPQKVHTQLVQVQSWDREYGDHSSHKQLRKLIFAWNIAIYFVF